MFCDGYSLATAGTESSRSSGTKFSIVFTNCSPDSRLHPAPTASIEYTLAHQNESKAELEYKLKNAGALDFTGDTPAFKTEHATNMILAIADRTGSRNKLENVFRAISNEIKTEVASRENPEVDMFSGPHVDKTKEQVVKQALDKVKGEDVQKSQYAAGLYLLKKSIRRNNEKGNNRRREIPPQSSNAEKGTGCSGRSRQKGRSESRLRKSQGEGSQGQEAGAEGAGERGYQEAGREGRSPGTWLIKSWRLRKSQMAFNFTGSAHDHHVAYTRTNASGTVSRIQAKGAQTVKPAPELTAKYNIDAMHPELVPTVKEVVEKIQRDFGIPRITVNMDTNRRGSLGHAFGENFTLHSGYSDLGFEQQNANAGMSKKLDWVTAHEFGHVIDGIIKDASGKEGEKNTGYDKAIRKIKSNHKSDPTNSHLVSIYSMKDNGEYVAEHFADAITNGDNAHPYSKKVYQAMKEWYGKNKYKGLKEAHEGFKKDKEEEQAKRAARLASMVQPGEHPGNGSIVEDASGNEYLVMMARNTIVNVAPITNGKAEVNRDSIISFNTDRNFQPASDSTRYMKLFKTGRNYYDEQEHKEPWQQTKEQYGNDEDHEAQVYRAMQQGKPVPAEVREQYPEFAYLHRDSKKHLKKPDPKAILGGPLFKLNDGEMQVKNPLPVFGGHSDHTSAEASVAAEELNKQELKELFNTHTKQYAGVEDVPVSKLHSIQTTVSESKVKDRAHSYSEEKSAEDYPIVFRLADGTLVLKDGNHRAVGALLANKTHIKAKVYDIIPDGVKKSLAGTFLLRKSTKGLVLTPTVNINGQQIHRWKLGEVAEHAGKQTSPEKATLREAILAVKDGTINRHEGIMILGRTPMILRKLGLPSHKMVISPKKLGESVFTSMHPEGKHGIPADILSELPEHLNNPMMVFASKQDGRLVVVTDLMHDGKPVVAVVIPDAQYKRNVVNAVASIHPRQIGEVEQWIGQGLLRYVNKKKSKSWAQIHGLQLPVMCTSHACSHNPNILHEEIEVKKTKLNKSLRPGLWLLRPADIHVADGNQKRPAVGMELSKANLHSPAGVADHLVSERLTDNRKSGQIAGNSLKRREFTARLVKGFADCIGNDQSSHNTLQKSELPSGEVKVPAQNDLTTAHQRKNPDSTRIGTLVYTAEGIKKSRLLCQSSGPLPGRENDPNARTCKRRNQNISPSKNGINKSLRSGLWLRKSQVAGNKLAYRSKSLLAGNPLGHIPTSAERMIRDAYLTSGFDGVTLAVGRFNVEAPPVLINPITNNFEHNTLQKSESPTAEVKAPPQNDLTKAHIAEYDRTTASGALAHVMAHEDSRVKKYGKQLMKIRNHADLHNVRKERFAHLPHWGSLPEHTQNEILLAEEHLHRQISRFEKPEEKPDADKVDRSDWKQARLFKGHRAKLYLIRRQR